MNSICVSHENKLLPFLLVIKVYTGFLMGNSIYSINILGQLLFLTIWILFFRAYYRKCIYLKSNVKISFFLISIYFLSVFILESTYLNKAILYDISLVYIFASFSKTEQIRTFKYFINFGSVLLFFSIIEYLLFIVFQKGIILGTFDRGENEYTEQPVIQGVFNYYTVSSYSFFRFQSLFREPGHLGQCAGLVLLFWRRIPLKQSIIWLISGFMTASLFFYVFLILELPILLHFQKKLTKKSIGIKFFVVLSAFLLVGYFAIPKSVKELLSYRIETMKESGKDNRSTVEFNEDIEKLFSGPDFLFGYGSDSFISKGYAWGNTGVKSDLYKFGTIGIIVVLLGFIILIASYPASRKTKMYIFFVFLLFYYNADIKYSLYIYIPLLNLLYLDGKMNYLNK